MPKISEFFGIIIRIFFEDHNPPHFHAEYAGKNAQIEIKSGKIIDGNLPKTAKKLVEEWRKLHVSELLEDWELASQLQMPKKIEPLE